MGPSRGIVGGARVNTLTIAVIAGFCIVVGSALGWWFRDRQLMPSDDRQLIHAKSVGRAAQGRYEHYRARCVYLESSIAALNRDLDSAKRQIQLLNAENQDMADLLHDYVSVNSCDLHRNQAFLAARVQLLKGCGFGISEIQNRIFGYVGGAAYYKIKPFFDGDVSMHSKAHDDWQGTEVNLCSCVEADWKAEQGI